MSNKKCNRKMEGLVSSNMEFNQREFNLGLSVFPGELWELILLKLTNSEDIFNVLRAFHDLDGLFANKKFAWMFDLILPHILTKYLLIKNQHGQEDYEYLESSYLYGLRLISKSWKNAVESSIENHSDRHLTDYKSIGKHSLALIPENHFNYHRMQKFHMGATIFNETKHIDQFLNEMGNYNGNPFPGKFVFIHGVKYASDGSTDIFARKAVQLLQKFGQHILVLDWEINNDGDDTVFEMCKIILKGLTYVPNLKSLTLRGDYDLIYDDESDNDFFKQSVSQDLFPELRSLERFDWRIRNWCEENSWTSRMMNTYGKRNGIRKLAIDICHFTADFVQTTLLELHLLVEHIQHKEVDEVEENLSLIPIGQIRKLCISDLPWRQYDKGFCINKFLKMLENYQIENVVLDRFYITEDEDECDDTTMASSITSLYLEDNVKLKYQFLKRLPNLRFLTIFMNYSTYRDIKFEGDGDAHADKLRKYFFLTETKHVPNPIQIFGDFSIWKVLPKLEMLSVTIDNGNEMLDVQYLKDHGNKPFFGYNPYVGSGRIEFSSPDEEASSESSEN